MGLLLPFSGVFCSSMIDPDTRETIIHPSYILTFEKPALYEILLKVRNFSYMVGVFFMLGDTAIASTTRRRVGRPIGFSLGLGIAKVYAEHWQFGSFNGVHQTSFFHSYAIEIKSIQLYDSIVMTSP